MRNFTFKGFNLFKLSFLILLFFITTQTRAQFPYSQSFKNSTAPGVLFGGEPQAFLTGGAGLKDGYNDANGSGYLRLTNKQGSQKGIVYSDMYSFPSAYGMTISFEYYTHGGNGADGIAFILFDATASPVAAGAFGGSLGYAQRNAETGFSKGYLGIGIDEYGNFSANNEGKSGGAPGGVLPSNVTLRGAGTGTSGYPHLISVQTTALASSFNVAGGDRAATDNSKSGFRKMEVVLKPRSGGGFFIDVYLTHGSIRELIINNYEYKITAPSNLKFAISSSTGGSNNFHEIRNLNITVDKSTLLTPVANADTFTGCIGLATTSGDITSNDNGSVNTLGTINKSTVDLDPAVAGIQTTKTVANKGTFTYNSTTGAVTFNPLNNTVTGPVQITYTFNDTYDKTSNTATITYNTYTAITNNSITAPSTSTFCTAPHDPGIITGSTAAGGSTSSGGPSTLTYQWESSINNIDFNPISGATNESYDPPSTSTTAYYRRVVSSATCKDVSNVVSIVFGQASTPTATAATAITCNSFTANWNVVPNATSYGLSVSKDSNFSTHEGNLDGRNLNSSATSFNVSGLTSGQTYYFKVWSFNSCGVGPTASNVITVTVGSGSIAGTISSAQTICSGTAPQDLTLSGYTGTIQWQSSTNNSSFNDISGAVGAVLTSAQMGSLTANTYYRAVVKSGACTAANTASVLITISAVPSLASISQFATTCEGAPARINLKGLLPNTTSTIAYSIDGLAQTPVTGVVADGSGDSFFETVVLTAANNGKTLRVSTVTTTSATPSCSNIVNKDVVLNVNAASVGGTIASVAAICSGTSPANLVLSGNNGSVLRWQKSTDSGFSTRTDINVASATLTSANIGNLTANTYFRAIVQNGACAAAFSDPVLVTVNALPAVLSLIGNTICVSPGGNGTISSSTSANGISYQLYNSGNTAVQSAKSGNGSALTWTNLPAAIGYYVIGTNNATTCSSKSSSVNILTTPNPDALVLTGSTICVSPGGNGTITSSTSVTGIDYQLYNSSNATVQVAKSGTGSALTWTNLPAGNSYYVIGTNTTTTCSSTSNTVNVATTLNPTAPVLTGSVICALPGGDGTISSTTSVNNVNYQLFDSNDVAVQSVKSGNGSALTWTNLNAANGYYVIATNTANCTVKSNVVNITTNPNPTISIGGTLTACLTTTLTTNTNVSSPTYVWYKNNIVISDETSSSLVVDTDGDYKVKVTNTSTGCETTSAAATVKVSDTEKPAKPILADITAECSATVTPPTTTDNCKGTITGTTSDSLDYSTQGEFTINWSFNDGNGNTETATQKVIIKDTQKPTITCPSTVVVSADANSCSATAVTLGTPVTSDNCTGTITVTNDAPLSFPIGNTTVTWKAVDAAGNTETCTQTVTVNDTQKPTITCPSTVIVSADANSCSATAVTLGTPVTSDNCTGTITVTNDAPSSFPIGNTTVTWKAVDAAGNTETCTQTVTVNDTQKPTLTCPSTVVVSADANSCSATAVTLGTPVTSDNCTGTITITNDAPSSFPIGSTTVTWKAVDAAGNTETCTQTVTVNDTQKPTLTCPSTVVFSADANSCSATAVTLGTPVTSDNCTGTITVTNDAPSSFPIGNTTVTWKAVDAAGNTETCTQIVKVVGPIIANKDAASINGYDGGTAVSDVLANDLLNCAAIVRNEVILTLDSTLPSVLTFDTTTGKVTVKPNTPIGVYSFDYKICEIANAANCNKATVEVTVTAPSILAVKEDLGPINGSTGGTTTSLIASDKLNGVQAVIGLNPGEVTLSGTAPAGLTVNADGTIRVSQGVKAGSYDINYTICDNNNAGNCSSATSTVMVTAGVLIANLDTVSGSVTGGNTAQTLINIFENDTHNGSKLNPSDVKMTSGTDPKGYLTIDTNGNAVLGANAPAGNYEITYEICEILNPGNCSSNKVEVTVTAPSILAVKEDLGPINGSTGGTTTSLIASDKLNGVQAVIGLNPGEVTLSGTAPAGLTVNADGTVSVSQGVKAGSYDVQYTICDNNNLGNCSSATSTVTVTAGVLIANLDTVSGSVIGGNTSQTLINIFENDTHNGSKLNPSDVKMTSGTDPKGYLTIDTNGNAVLGANAPAGNYEITYEICELLNPGNCSSNKVEVTVTAPSILAVKEDLGPINGSTGGTTTSLIASDKLNGVQAVIGSNSGEVTLSGTAPAGLTVNADGTVSVSQGVKAGSYDINYTICDNNNPGNCSSATSTVTVTAGVLIANLDTVSGSVTGGNTAQTLINIFENDTHNGSKLNPSDVKMTSGTDPKGYLTIDTNGNAVLGANAPAGNYEITYEICELLNLGNCSSNKVEVTVTAPSILAVKEDLGPVNGSTGGTTTSLIASDKLNGIQAVIGSNPGEVILSGTAPAGLTVNADGTVSVSQGVKAGSYDINYTICDNNNPGNCSSATSTVMVTAGVLIANLDKVAGSVTGGNTSQTLINIFENDTHNGSKLNPSDVKMTSGTDPKGYLTIDTNGNAVLGANAPAGNYEIEYEICELLNPGNCSSNKVEVTVTGANLVANEDLVLSAVGVNVSQTLTNVFTNDTKNGNALVPSDVKLTAGTDPKGYLTLDENGNVILAPNAPAGDYELPYTICEKLNTSNCSSNVVKVTVTEPKMTVTADSYCSNNVPYVNYTVTPDNFTTTNLLTIKWIDIANNVVATQTNLALSGTVIWPGAVVDGSGNGKDWPGWVLNNGQWTQGSDGFELTKNGVKMEFSLNPTVTVSVAYPAATSGCNARPTFSIKANDDEAGPVDVKKGVNAVVNIFANDLLNGVKPNPSDIILSTVVANSNLTLNANGSIDIAANTPNGVHELTYQICDASNTGNCSQAVIKITVLNSADPAPPTAGQFNLGNDSNISVDGINGSIEFVNVLDNDLINGQPINSADVVVKPITINDYFEWNADGTVSVKPNTPGGNYPLTYQVCEKGSALNCATAVLNVFVEVPAIAVVKTAVFNDENKSGFANAGETITYNFTVTNTGNVPLINVLVTDPLSGVVVSGQAISLAVGETNNSNFSAVYKITQEDINRGSVSNQATVKGSSARGVNVEDLSDDSNNSGDNPTVLDLNGCSIKVLNAFSPNGDEKNARFYIRGIECYPENTVEIYNRWGVLVFSIDHYNNTDRSFTGYSNGRSTVKQTDGLPVGTYFYILKYKDSASNPHQESSYLYINK